MSAASPLLLLLLTTLVAASPSLHHVDPPAEAAYLSQHTDTAPQADVAALAFTPDGLRLVAAGLDKTVRTYVKSGEKWVLESVNVARDYVNCVAVSPGGEFLVIGGDGFTLELFVWKTGIWQPFQSFSAPLDVAAKLKKHEMYGFMLGKVFDVSFSPKSRDGRLAVASGGWEGGIVALLQKDESTGQFEAVSVFSGFFTKWAVSSVFHSGGKHLLAASPDQAIAVLEVHGGPQDAPAHMRKSTRSSIEWYLRDDNDRWQRQDLVYDPSGPCALCTTLARGDRLVEFHRMSNNIQNHARTSTNNFIRDACWLDTERPGFVTVGHEGHVRVYEWNEDVEVFNATCHWQDNADGTPIAAVAAGVFAETPFFVTASHGRVVNVVAEHVGEWVHVQRLTDAVGGMWSGARALAVSPDGSLVAVGGRSVSLFAVVDVPHLAAPHQMDALDLDDTIRDRHYRIE